MASRLRSRLRIIPGALLQRAVTIGRRQRPHQPRRILIVHHLLLGDAIMVTPLTAKLRQQFPAAEIVVALPKAIAPLYAGRPFGVHAVPWDPRDASTLAPLLTGGGYDLAFVPADNRHSWLALAAGARWIVAHERDRPMYKSWPVDELRAYPTQPTALGEIFADLIDGAPPSPFVPADWPAPPAAAFPLPSTPYAVLHVGASTPLKLWEPEKWRAIVAWLGDAGISTVWSGGRSETHLIDSVDPQRRFPSYAGKLDLAQMWRLLADAKLLVCPDTGIAHLGRLVNVPTVALFGPGSATCFGPGEFWRESPYRAVTVAPFECRNQSALFKRPIVWLSTCERSPAQCPAPRCMQAIDVDMVKVAIRQLLGDQLR